MRIKIEHKILQEKSFMFIGCVFYGDPFHSAKEWTIENEIGKLWERYGELLRKNWRSLSKHFINPNISYELHIEPEEYIETKNYYVFTGTEIKEYEEVPLEFFIKKLPTTDYLMFTAKAIDFDKGEYYFKKWLPQSEYEQAYPYIIQAYDITRFKGLEDNESEIDWYIPIKSKSLSDKN